jgi:hypothetical protein
MDLTTSVTIAVSVLLAVVGYVATYAYNLKLAQRKDRLDRVNAQLSDFYGPLLALVSAGESSFGAFRQKHRPDKPWIFERGETPSEQKSAAWRLWMVEVFMPLNVAIVDVITKHADLLDESDMPQPLLDACAHVAAYRAVIKQWEQGDFSELGSVINFPSPDLFLFASEGFTRLKGEQQRLLGQKGRPR